MEAIPTDQMSLESWPIDYEDTALDFQQCSGLVPLAERDDQGSQTAPQLSDMAWPVLDPCSPSRYRAANAYSEMAISRDQIELQQPGVKFEYQPNFFDRTDHRETSCENMQDLTADNDEVAMCQFLSDVTSMQEDSLRPTRKTSHSSMEAHSDQLTSPTSTEGWNSASQVRSARRTPRHTFKGTKPLRSQPGLAKQTASEAHSMVERRYRHGLNTKMQELAEALARAQFDQLGHVSKNDDENVDSGDTKKRTKSDILSDAINFIHSSEVEMRHLETEISDLKSKVRMLEKLVDYNNYPVDKEVDSIKPGAPFNSY